jgi:TonB family protein
MKAIGVIVFVVMLTLFAGEMRGQSNAGESAYKPVDITAASDIAYPPATSTTGFVTLDANVDPSGSVQNVRVVRDVPSLTDAALTAVKNWSFSAAQLNGSAVAGRMRVNVVFNPFNPGGVGIPGEALGAAGPTNGGGDFVPAKVTAANYATYPANTVASGTVVLDVHVGKNGKVEQVKAVRGTDPLTAAATSAVKSWKFAPATYQGKAVSSRLVVAFVFASPSQGTQ